MSNRDLAELLARLEQVPPAKAADQLERTLRRILRTLRKGHAVSLPGVGTLAPAVKGQKRKSR